MPSSSCAVLDRAASAIDWERVADDLLTDAGLSLLPQIFAHMADDLSFWQSERGETVLANILFLLMQHLDLRDPQPVFDAMGNCPPGVAEQGYVMLATALCPDGSPDGPPNDPLHDPLAIDDAAMLCFALLRAAGGRVDDAGEIIRRASDGRTSRYFYSSAGAMLRHFESSADPAEEPFTPKLIIWDLDDTLWHGTLAEGDVPILMEHRAAHIRAFNNHGIVSAICSKNDSQIARAQLEAMGLWDQFVFPRIAFVPKGPVIRQMIADMQLRPANILFIDDNPFNLQEVAQAVPGIRVMDATSSECDLLLERIAQDHAHIGKSRIADYRILEAKAAERGERAASDGDFLLQSDIKGTAVFRMDNLEFAERIEELINRSNQLNYTQTRVSPGEVRRNLLDMDRYFAFTAFVWDKYGYYGLVGVIIYDHVACRTEHFALSCRVMHMGVEAMLIDAMAERFPEFPFDPAQLKKAMPPRPAHDIVRIPYDAEARSFILEQEAPRDWSAIRLRVMADCQSGVFHHYSRFRDEIDYDNSPRHFTLPMMETGEYAAQTFHPYLVYAVGGDYAEWRWEERLSTGLDEAMLMRCIDRFADMVVKGGHQCLLLLPPENWGLSKYKERNADQSRRRHVDFNAHWRKVATENSSNFKVIELETVLIHEDHHWSALHYTPSALRHITGMIDDWYAAQQIQAMPLAS